MAAPLNAGAKSYDEVPYRGKPFRQTHPEWLATIAHLVALPSPDIYTARVLELGCCDGGNLLPMAVDLPNAKFVGIDYSTVQIEMGRQTVRQLGIKNLDLRDISILDVDESLGEFDYIISHGVFSWVPDAVAEKMLDICARHLAPNGVAYLSYNTYPGWYMRGAVRDMMRYHALRFDTATRRIHEARLLLEFTAKHAHGFNAEAYGKALKNEADLLKGCPDHYIYHEHLEDHSRPYYFHEFVAKAQSRGLDFLSESRLSAMAVANYSEEEQTALSAIATNVIELEQFMDFLRNRTFRETLLHRAGQSPKYDLSPERVHGLYVTGTIRSNESTVDVSPETPVRFEGPSKVPVTTTTPILKAAFTCLMNAYPASIRFETLLEKSRELLHRAKLALETKDRDARTLALGLLKVYMSSDLIEFSVAPSRFTVQPGTKPEASPIARLQAADPSIDYSATRRHDVVRLDATCRMVLELCDGAHSLKDMTAKLPQLSPAKVEAALRQLGRSAMLIS